MMYGSDVNLFIGIFPFVASFFIYLRLKLILLPFCSIPATSDGWDEDFDDDWGTDEVKAPLRGKQPVASGMKGKPFRH